MSIIKIGLWSDSHHFPSLPLMKLSAYHKRLGDTVELYDRWNMYDLVYASKTFSFTEDIDVYPVMADEIRKGGTGYCINICDGKEVFDKEKNINLSAEVEMIYPDYTLYPCYDYAVGFLTRGCPRNCGFCVVGKKEGLCSHQVADLTDFWKDHKKIKLLDPNLLACRDHERLLKQLANSEADVDFTQGLDIRLTNPDNIKLLNTIKTSAIHFAWDNPKEDLTKFFKRFNEHTAIKSDRNKIVYVLTNYNSTMDENLYRIYTLRNLGYLPYVMVYQKETAPHEIRRLQRWVNCRPIFRSVKKFEDYK